MYRQEDQQSLAESLNEPEVSGLWDWDSKVPRGTLINHVPVAAVTSPTFNELVAYFSTDKFTTQLLKHVRNWYKVLSSCGWKFLRNQLQSQNITDLNKFKVICVIFLVVSLYRVLFKHAALH